MRSNEEKVKAEEDQLIIRKEEIRKQLAEERFEKLRREEERRLQKLKQEQEELELKIKEEEEERIRKVITENFYLVNLVKFKSLCYVKGNS